MALGVYLAQSHSWLHARLSEQAPRELPGVEIVDSRDDADLIIWPRPPWNDPEAGETLRSFGPRELRRIYVYSQEDEPYPWAPGVYVSLAAARAGNAYRGGSYIPHHHYEDGGIREHLELARTTEPDLLWSFVGTLSNHPVRGRLAAVTDERGLVRDTQTWNDRLRWGWGRQYRSEGQQAFSEFASVLGRSSFVLCPRGRGPGSIRLFEAMQAERCPVIIADDWLAPPFVDWEACSIRIAEEDVDDLPAILREREGEARRLGEEARRVWARRYAPRHQFETLVRSCVDIHEGQPRRLASLTRASLSRGGIRLGARAAKAKVASFSFRSGA